MMLDVNVGCLCDFAFLFWFLSKCIIVQCLAQFELSYALQVFIVIIKTLQLMSYDNVPSNHLWYQKISSSEDTVETVIF